MAAEFSRPHFVPLPELPVNIPVNHKSHNFPVLLVLDKAKAFLSSNSSAPKKNLLSETPVAVLTLIQVVCHKIFVAFQNNFRSNFKVLFDQALFFNLK